MAGGLQEPWVCNESYTVEEWGKQVTKTCTNKAESASNYIDAATMLSYCNEMKGELAGLDNINSNIASYCEIDKDSLSIEGVGVEKIVTAAQSQTIEEIQGIAELISKIETDIVDAYNLKQDDLDRRAKANCPH